MPSRRVILARALGRVGPGLLQLVAGGRHSGNRLDVRRYGDVVVFIIEGAAPGSRRRGIKTKQKTLTGGGEETAQGKRDRRQQQQQRLLLYASK